MIAECKLIVFIINIVCVLTTINSYILKDLNFSPDYYSSPLEKGRETFLNRRRQNRVSAKRVQVLDQYLFNSSVFVDGIMHQIIDKKHKELEQVNEFEKAFRNLIGLNGVKFTYKRDQYWRTWRRVKYPDGEKIVCYKCESSVNCTSCQNGGYWVIEENPPCPFEIVSVISNEEVCAVDITNTNSIEEQCPSVVQFIDINRMCDNPINTQWRLQKVYNNDVSERYPAIVCGGRDFCEISTFYLITRNYVSFRIINSTNHVLYSRIMKNNKKNYACVADCGKIDPNKKTVSKTDEHLVIDLINSKNKRDDKTQKINSTLNDSTTAEEKVTPKIHIFRNEKWKHPFNEIETTFNQENPEKHHHHHNYDKKHPSCSSMKMYNTQNDINDMSDEVNNPFH